MLATLACLGLAAAPLGCGNNAVQTPAPGNSGNTNNTEDNGDSNAGGDAVNDPNVVPTSGGLMLAPGASGYFEVPMVGCTLSDYHARAAVGNDNVLMLIDSGSPTMAVAATTCTTCGRAEGYDTSHGTNLASRASASYGDGSYWSGGLYSDTVQFGQAPAVKVAFAAITMQGNDFFSLPSCYKDDPMLYDGILGLAPDTLLDPKATGYMTTLNNSKKLANNAFAVHTCDVGGHLMLGGYSSAYSAGDPIYVPLQTAGSIASYYYTIKMTGASIDGVPLATASSAFGTTIVDNGTSGLLLRSTVYAALVKSLSANAAIKANFSSRFLSEHRAEESAQNLTRAQLDAALPKLQLSFAQADGKTASLDLTASHSYLAPIEASDGSVYYIFVGFDSDETFNIIGNTVMRDHLGSLTAVAAG